SEPTTRLGYWYANLLHVGRLQLVIALSERTFVPVVLPAAPIATLSTRLPDGAGQVLRALGIPAPDVEREQAAMSQVAFGTAVNRQALGVMVDFAKLLPFFLEDTPSLLDLSLKLAGTPCGPLYKRTSFPDKETVATFLAKTREHQATTRVR
ncbi:MAG: DUF6933 domain-containing protein, partial [Polyangiaceae bacterium]